MSSPSLPRSEKRGPLCFLHIGKNGGTTLLKILDDLKGVGRVCPARHMEEIAAMTRNELASYDLFRGHFWYDVHELIGRKPVYFTMLRDPIERARSAYEHIHRHAHGRHDVVKRLSFEQYVFSDVSVSLDIRNWQTRVVTNCIEPSEEPDLSLAKRRVSDEFSFVGFTERYDESMQLLSYTFGWEPIVDYRVLNITESSMKGRSMEDGVRKKLEERNQSDRELYSFCESIFDKRLSEMRADADFMAKLEAAGVDTSLDSEPSP